MCFSRGGKIRKIPSDSGNKNWRWSLCVWRDSSSIHFKITRTSQRRRVLKSSICSWREENFERTLDTRDLDIKRDPKTSREKENQCPFDLPLAGVVLLDAICDRLLNWTHNSSSSFFHIVENNFHNVNLTRYFYVNLERNRVFISKFQSDLSPGVPSSILCLKSSYVNLLNFFI